MNCPRHRTEPTPCQWCALEARLPDEPVADRLAATADYVEGLTNRYALEGSVQGEVLHIASRIRELAKRLAA